MHKSDLLLIDFLKGKRKNFQGLYINDIWNFSEEQLESNHKYIQWIFPNKQSSKYNIFAPKIYDETLYCDPVIKNNIKQSFTLMLDFYGLEIYNDKIIECNDFNIKSKRWLRPNNHNFLRISRILKCLCLVEMKEYAKMFVDYLQTLYSQNSDIISDNTFNIWKNILI